MTQDTATRTQDTGASVWRNSWTAALVALVGVIIWGMMTAIHTEQPLGGLAGSLVFWAHDHAPHVLDVAVLIGAPAFFLGLIIWLIDLGIRGNFRPMALNTHIVTGEAFFITWALWSALAIYDAMFGYLELIDLQVLVSWALLLIGSAFWVIGLVRGSRGILDSPEPGSTIYTIWQPMVAVSAIAIIAGSIIMHHSLVVFGSILILVALFAWLVLIPAPRRDDARASTGERAYGR